jgi:hypothetical protein
MSAQSPLTRGFKGKDNRIHKISSLERRKILKEVRGDLGSGTARLSVPHLILRRRFARHPVESVKAERQYCFTNCRV